MNASVNSKFGETVDVYKDRLPTNRLYLSLSAGAAYLVLPYFIFFLGWFKLPFAIALVCSTGLVAYWMVRRIGERSIGDGAVENRLRPGAAISLIAASAAILILCGMGGILNQTSDWVKHNAVIDLLIDEPFPTIIATDTEVFNLSYYIAWHLPAVLVGKLAGWAAANLTLLAYSSAGLAITVYLASRVAGTRLLVTFVILLIFAGLDTPGQIMMMALTDLPATRDVIYSSDWWAVAFRYPGNVTQLFYVPNQSIAGWMLTVLMLAGIRAGAPLPALAFCAPVSLLWSPWITIGLIPFGVVFAALQLIDGTPVRRVLFAGKGSALDFGGYAAAALIGAATVLYFSMRFAVSADDFTPPSVGYREFTPGMEYFSGLDFFLVYLAFIALEIGGYVVICWWMLRGPEHTQMRMLLAVATAVLVLLPFARSGFFNDLVMRVSIPSLFVLMLVTCICFSNAPNRFARRVLSAFLVVCAVSGLIALRHEIQGALSFRKPATAFNEETIISLQCLHEKRGEQIRINWLRQYVGKQALPIHRYLLAERKVDPTRPIRRIPAQTPADGDRIKAACG